MRTIPGLILGVGLVGLLGCGPVAKPAATTKHEPDHEHGDGPHGGAIADWGRYHIEFTVDHGKQEATVYILGADEKTPAPIKAEVLTLQINDPKFTVELKASKQDSDPAGTASRFVGKHEKLGKEQEFAGTISGVVEGKTITGDFAEEPEPAPKK